MTGPPVHSARMTATRLLEPGDALGRRREVDAVGLVLLRVPADPDPEHEPAAARDLEGATIRATTAGWRFMTLSTKGPTVTRSVRAAAIARIVQHSTTGTSASPRPMKWSQDQTPA